MAKRLSPAAIVALKDTLCAIYGYKSDLRSFIHASISDPRILTTLNWDNYKRHLGDLTRLCSQITAMHSFEHLSVLDGGQDKAQRAERAVPQLRALLHRTKHFKMKTGRFASGKSKLPKSFAQMRPFARNWTRSRVDIWLLPLARIIRRVATSWSVS